MAVSCPEETVSSEGSARIGRYASSAWAERAWCTTCGSSLWYRITGERKHKGEYEIRVGLFDDPTGLTLKREIFIDRAAGVFPLAGAHQTTEAEVFAICGVESSGA